MKEKHLHPKLLLAQPAPPKFDAVAAEKKVEEQLATMDLEKIFAERKTKETFLQ